MMATMRMISLRFNFFSSSTSSSFANNDGYNKVGQLRVRFVVYHSHFWMDKSCFLYGLVLF